MPLFHTIVLRQIIEPFRIAILRHFYFDTVSSSHVLKSLYISKGDILYSSYPILLCKASQLDINGQQIAVASESLFTLRWSWRMAKGTHHIRWVIRACTPMAGPVTVRGFVMGVDQELSDNSLF